MTYILATHTHTLHIHKPCIYLQLLLYRIRLKLFSDEELVGSQLRREGLLQNWSWQRLWNHRQREFSAFNQFVFALAHGQSDSIVPWAGSQSECSMNTPL